MRLAVAFDHVFIAAFVAADPACNHKSVTAVVTAQVYGIKPVLFQPTG